MHYSKLIVFFPNSTLKFLSGDIWPPFGAGKVQYVIVVALKPFPSALDSMFPLYRAPKARLFFLN